MSGETCEHRVVDRVNIRWMIRRDMPEVVEIESTGVFRFRKYFSEDDILKILRKRSCIGMVAEHEGKIVGFMMYELFEDNIHIIELLTHKEFIRSGIGRQMVAKLTGKLFQRHRKHVSVFLHERNLEAQLFFRSCGFVATDVIAGYFDGDDLFEMCYFLGDHR